MMQRIILSGHGLMADLIPMGAVLQRLQISLPNSVPNNLPNSLPRADAPRDLTLGFPDPAAYPDFSPHFGATAGRYANRIRDGSFELDGKTIQLSCNQDGRHHLHGGQRGFGKRRTGAMRQRMAKKAIPVPVRCAAAIAFCPGPFCGWS
jgi:aldose 1-epimerase